jgi:hypothetical protein
MRTVRLRYTLGLTLCLMLVVGPAWAQQGGASGMQAGGTAYYTFARPGQNTIEVLVLGGGQSGVYEIGENINLGKLMALAGAGGGGGGRRETKVTIHLFRLENGNRTRVLKEGLGDLAERPVYPPLQEGDVVRIETRQGLNWRDWLRITTSVTSLTLTFLNVFGVLGSR